MKLLNGPARYLVRKLTYSRYRHYLKRHSILTITNHRTENTQSLFFVRETSLLC